MNWSAKAQGSTGKGDVTLWSDTKGLFGSAAVSVADIKYDADQTAAYYGQQNVAARDVVIDDKVSNSQADALKQTLASAASGAPPETSTSAASASCRNCMIPSACAPNCTPAYRNSSNR